MTPPTIRPLSGAIKREIKRFSYSDTSKPKAEQFSQYQVRELLRAKIIEEELISKMVDLTLLKTAY